MSLKLETAKLADLKPHPKNYRQHPDDQLAHIVESVKLHGFYRPIVIAKDATILAGHGLALAAGKLGLVDVPVIRLPIASDEPRALKILTGDNEMGNLAEVDDRALTEILREIATSTDGLLGTGFDDAQLAALMLVTRPSTEFKSIDEVAAWVGMPGYEEGGSLIKLIVGFKNKEDRDAFVKVTGIKLSRANPESEAWSTRWPWTEPNDRSTTEVVEEKKAPTP